MIRRVKLCSTMFQTDRATIEQAVRLAVWDALLAHKRNGNPVCYSRDGKVVTVPPDEIPVTQEQIHQLIQSLS